MPFANIIDFAERGLHITLRPVQRFILKLYFGVELNSSEEAIRFETLEGNNYLCTELEYLRYLYDEGRSNIREQAGPFDNLVLVAGRQIGKTSLGTIIATYTIARLLEMNNPHGRLYDFLNTIKLFVTIINETNNLVPTLRDQVTSVPELWDRCVGVRSFGADFLTASSAPQNGWNIRLQTRRSSSHPVHGSWNTLVVLDEMAHYQNPDQVFDAVTGSLLHPNFLLRLGGYAILTTPLRASGAVYEAFRHAMNTRYGSRTLALQIPTWEVMPDELERIREMRRHSSARQFLVEWGAQWDHSGRVVIVPLYI